MAPDIKNQIEKYRPDNGKWFPLKAIWVPEEELHVAIDENGFEKDLKKFFVRTVKGKKQYCLLIHPESEKFFHRDMGGFNIDMKSPQFDKEIDLMSSTTPEIDYHQAHIKAAREQSLHTYFDGGFLHNIESELKRCWPKRFLSSLE